MCAGVYYRADNEIEMGSDVKKEGKAAVFEFRSLLADYFEPILTTLKRASFFEAAEAEFLVMNPRAKLAHSSFL
jgi:hypothetical protein